MDRKKAIRYLNSFGSISKAMEALLDMPPMSQADFAFLNNHLVRKVKRENERKCGVGCGRCGSREKG